MRHARPSRLILIVFSTSTLTVAGFAAGQTTQPDPHAAAFDAARGMLHDTSVRMDGDGVQLARTRLEAFRDKAGYEVRTLQLLGLADFASLMSPDMTGSTTSPEEGKIRLERALESFTEASNIDPDNGMSWVLRALGEQLLANKDKEDWGDNLGDASAESLASAARLAPNDADVMTVRAFVALMGGTSDVSGGTLLTQAIEQYRTEPAAEADYESVWWSLIARGMQARMHQMSGQHAKALRCLDEALAIDPEFAMASTLRPTIAAAAAAAGEGYTMLAVGAVPRLRWIAIAEDEAGDGRETALADGRAFSYAYDPESSDLWFRFELHDAPDASAFGVNIIVDDDADQTTGVPWWGTNDEFTWDRLITAWLARESDGRYVGVLGVGDLAGAQSGDFASLHRGGIRFTVLEQEDAIVIGVPRALLSDGDQVNLIGAVGSNQMWNDDLMDEGYATVDLHVN